MVTIKKNTLRITLKRQIDESYDIVIGSNLFKRIAADLKKLKLGSKYAVITDSNIEPLYANKLKKALKNFKVDIFTFKAGENSKNMNTCSELMDEMSKKGFGRDSVILALGGGVVGDIAGFIAAIFNRGISYIQIPTTILAQADSSIGGKTGIDTKYGKNLVGAFKQPKKVYIDIAMLKKLPIRQIKSGLAETIKHAVIADRKFFNYLKLNMNKILNKDKKALKYIAFNNCRIKGNLVEQDPLEKNQRQKLNYGHTIGHAIEQLSKYKLSHGEAISIGMMAAGGIAKFKDLEEQKQLLIKAGLPVKIPKNIKDEDIFKATLKDKKARQGKARYVLPKRIGEMMLFNGKQSVFIKEEAVKKALKETR